MKTKSNASHTTEPAIAVEPVLCNVYSKESAVQTYVKEIGIAIQELISHPDHPTYYFNNDGDYKKRIEVIDKLHKCAMDALALI